MQAYPAAGVTQSPQLIKQEDGGTVLEWHGSVSGDRYETDASGGRMLTPLESDNYYKVDVDGDIRATSPSGAVSYAMISLTNTNDRSVLSHSTQINTLQLGRVTQAYEFAVGDVNPSFSSLGTNLALRGVLAEARLGETRIAGSAGVAAESWASLCDSDLRYQYQRDAYAFKLDTPVVQSMHLYLTAQGYNDRESSLDAGMSALSPASTRAATMGFTFQRSQFTVEGEIGTSRWKEEGQDSESDNAYILDAGWRAQKGGLRAGHHNIGLYYAALSGMAAPGIRETYLNGDWATTSWLTIDADLRRSKTEQAAGTTIAETVDTITAGANINFDPLLPGLGLRLQQYRSIGENSDGSDNTNENYSAMLSYLSQHWNSGISYSHDDMSNDAGPEANGTTGTWTGNLGFSLNKDSTTGVRIWWASMNIFASWQDQDLDNGTTTKNRSYNLELTAERAGWGILTSNVGWGTTAQPTGGPDLHQRNIDIKATYPFMRNWAIEFYLQENKNWGDPDLRYSEKTIGLQLKFTR